MISCTGKSCEVLIRMLLQQLREQKQYRIVFLPVEEMEKIVFDTPLTVSRISVER
jgi:hypothetical protein